MLRHRYDGRIKALGEVQLFWGCRPHELEAIARRVMTALAQRLREVQAA